MTRQPVILQINPKPRSCQKPVRLGDVIANTEFVGRRKFRIQMTVRDLFISGVRIPDINSQLTKCDFDLGDKAKGAERQPVFGKLALILRLNSPQVEVLGSLSATLTQYGDILSSLQTFFSAPLTTQESVDKIGEDMFTVNDGIHLEDKLVKSEANIAHELAALSDVLPAIDQFNASSSVVSPGA